jgi:hypothetical protein
VRLYIVNSWYIIICIIPEKLNSNLSELPELHGSLRLSNMNVAKYIKQLQSHLEDETSECESSSEQ